MKKSIVLLVFLLYSVNCFTQTIISSNTYIQTRYHHSLCFSVNSSSYLYYDESKQSLYLKIDFTKFKSGQDSLDEWLDDLTSTFFYFKAELDKHIFEGGFANHHSKVIRLKGQAYLNGVWHSQEIEIDLYSAENGVSGTNNNTSVYENIRVNFSLSIMPKDYKVHKKPHHLKKVINIGVTLGRINLLQPGMEKQIEVYDHH